MTRVVFLLVPQLHLMDLAGPAEVFSTAADLGYGYALSYVAEQEEIPTAQGLPLRAGVSWPDLAAEDLVVVPGWRAPTLRRNARLDPSTARKAF